MRQATSQMLVIVVAIALLFQLVLKMPKPKYFVPLDRIAERLDRLNNILSNAYCSLCSSIGTQVMRGLIKAKPTSHGEIPHCE
jgi:hypothetical protein